ncbi:uncharacterized protein TNCV_4995281 [Trichonephila clavipes]|nr:uncharacterized protein TNCV_4995281 [Trichonephila clavipes]
MYTGCTGLKVSKSYDLLLRNYPSECNKLFIRGLENPPIFFGYSRSASRSRTIRQSKGDKLVTLASLVKMQTLQQKVQCVLWLTKFKSATRVQQRVRTEWNVVAGLPNRLIRTPSK